MNLFKKAALAVALAACAGVACAADLPAVKILATGGTIAGTAASNTQLTGYQAGALAIQTLIDAVPAVKSVADVSGEQIVKISSNNMNDVTLLKLARRCNELLADPKVSGIVITHGTDTLEETAYFLNLTVHSDKPVVLVGAMRPATAISADGPLNLLNAVKVAVSPEARGKGTLIVMNDEIEAARDVTKSNTTNVDTFQSPRLGALGFISAGVPQFFRASTKRHTAASEFDVSKLDTLPRVDIIYSHVNDDGVMANAAVAAGAKGIIHAGTGNGSVADPTDVALEAAVKKGVTVVRAARVGSGVTTHSVPKWTEHGYLLSNTLSPQKARILLQLALTQTSDPKKIQQYFNEY